MDEFKCDFDLLKAAWDEDGDISFFAEYQDTKEEEDASDDFEEALDSFFKLHHESLSDEKEQAVSPQVEDSPKSLRGQSQTRQKILELENQLKSCRNKVTNLTTQNEQLKRDRQSMSGQIRRLTKQCEDLTQTKIRNEKQLTALTSQKAIQDRDNEIQLLRKELKKMKNRQSRSSNVNSASSCARCANIHQSRTELNELRRDARNREQSIAAKERQFKKEKQELVKSIERLESEKDMLRRRQQETDERHQQLQERGQELRQARLQQRTREKKSRGDQTIQENALNVREQNLVRDRQNLQEREKVLFNLREECARMELALEIREGGLETRSYLQSAQITQYLQEIEYLKEELKKAQANPSLVVSGQTPGVTTPRVSSPRKSGSPTETERVGLRTPAQDLLARNKELEVRCRQAERELHRQRQVDTQTGTGWNDEHRHPKQLGKNSKLLELLNTKLDDLETKQRELTNRIYHQQGLLAKWLGIKDLPEGSLAIQHAIKRQPYKDAVSVYQYVPFRDSTVPGRMLTLVNENRNYVEFIRRLETERNHDRLRIANLQQELERSVERSANLVAIQGGDVESMQVFEEQKALEGGSVESGGSEALVVARQAQPVFHVGSQLTVISGESLSMELNYHIPNLEDEDQYPHMVAVKKVPMSRQFLKSINGALNQIGISLLGLEATRRTAQKCLEFCDGDENNPFIACIFKVSSSVQEIMKSFAMKTRTIAVGLDHAASEFGNMNYMLENGIDVRKLEVRMDEIVDVMTRDDEKINELHERASENIRQALNFLFQNVIGKHVCSGKQEELAEARRAYENSLEEYTVMKKRLTNKTNSLKTELSHWQTYRKEIQSQMDDLDRAVRMEANVLSSVESMINGHLRQVAQSIKEEEKRQGKLTTGKKSSFGRERMRRAEERDLKTCLTNLRSESEARQIGQKEMRRLSKKKVEADRQINDIEEKLDGLMAAQVNLDIKERNMIRDKESLHQKETEYTSLLEEGQDITSRNLEPFLDMLTKLRKQTEMLSLNMTSISTAFERVLVSCKSKIFKRNMVIPVNWRKRAEALRKASALMYEVALLGQEELVRPLEILQRNNCIDVMDTLDNPLQLGYVPSTFSRVITNRRIGLDGAIEFEFDEKEAQKLRGQIDVGDSAEEQIDDPALIGVGSSLQTSNVEFEVVNIVDEYDLCVCRCVDSDFFDPCGQVVFSSEQVGRLKICECDTRDEDEP